MPKKYYALALCTGAWLLTSAALAEEPSSLAEATQKTLKNHPALQVFALREEALLGRRQTSALRPGFELNTELENFAGSGTTQGFDDTELTISLSSVIELGAKRAARLASIDARAGLLQTEKRLRALDLLGGMTTQFITVLVLQERLGLAQESKALAAETTEAVEARVEAGAAPEAELLRSQALASQASLNATQIDGQLGVAKVALGAFWGKRQNPGRAVQGDLFAFGAAIDFAPLFQRVIDSPNIQMFASEERLQDAAVQLAKSRNRLDLRWSLGVRRLEGPGDSALVASVQMPLFAGRRNRGELAAAKAQRGQVSVRRDQALNELYARLFDAYRTRALSIKATRTLQSETIPTLSRALATTRAAYGSGRYSYLDLIAAQQALLEAKATLLDAAAAALQSGVVIEQLTGLSLLEGSAGGQQQRKEQVQ